jgi:Ulp1 family protease
MDKAFAEHALEFENDEISDHGPAKVKRKPKLKDQLRLSDGEPCIKMLKKERRDKTMMAADGTVESRDVSPAQGRRQRSPSPAKPLKSILKRGDQPPESDTDTGTDIPVEPLGATARETRASSRRGPAKHLEMNGDGMHGLDKKHLLEDDGFRKNWKKPLVYPPNGKKKAEVNLDDRDRLQEDIFLNDNLIAFYMRFLQDHLERTNKDAAKRVYFFNSYFFATLTNAKSGELNYKGVEKWTRGVDLFSYDYILVPINEHHHWYIAIICNLPTFSLENAEPVEHVKPAHTSPTKKPTTIPDSKVQEIQETPEPEPQPESRNASEGSPKKYADHSSELSKDSETRRGIASLSIEESEIADKDAKSHEEKTSSVSGEEQDADEKPKSSPVNLSKLSAQKLAQDEAAASQSTGKSKKKRSGPKLDPNQTTIITFDSLGLGRSPTIKVLREYISLEANSKRGVKIETNKIKGMRGQGIPTQMNFSDCGLYLLAYVEKFVQCPDWFITKMLQRSMDSKNDWPALGSGLLRYRLRKFLDGLYEEQFQTDQQSNKPIMADRTPIDFLLGPPLPRQNTADIDVVPESQPEIQQKKDASTTLPTKQSTSVDSTPQKVAEDPSEDSAVDQMYMVPTESPRAPKAKTSKTASERPRKDRSSPAKEEPVIQVPCSQEEPESSRTPPPADTPRKRKSPRGPPKA